MAKPSYWSKGKQVPFGSERCVFPKPSESPIDPRALKVGDRVCIEKYGDMNESTILKVYPPTGNDGQRYLLGHPNGSNFSTLRWTEVGVFQPWTASKTAIGKIAEDKNLPEDIEGVIKKFGGRKKKRLMSRKYCKKTPCRKMGFTQRASCRPYKNCFKPSS